MELEWIQPKGRVSGWWIFGGKGERRGTNRSLDGGGIRGRVSGGSGRETGSGNVAVRLQTMSA